MRAELSSSERSSAMDSREEPVPAEGESVVTSVQDGEDTPSPLYLLLSSTGEGEEIEAAEGWERSEETRGQQRGDNRAGGPG